MSSKRLTALILATLLCVAPMLANAAGKNVNAAYLSTTDSSLTAAGEPVVFGGHRYQLYASAGRINWHDAKAYCENKGGHLVTITSAAEQEFLANHMRKFTTRYACYIGYTDELRTDDWEWITGEKSAYSNWGYGEPNHYCEGENYGVMYAPQCKWVDERDFLGDAFICEWEYAQFDPACAITATRSSANVGEEVGWTISPSEGSGGPYAIDIRLSRDGDYGEYKGCGSHSTDFTYSAKPTVPGDYAIEVKVTDAAGKTVTAVSPTITVSTAQTGAINAVGSRAALYKGHTYQLYVSDAPVSWQTAKAFCKAKGGYLVTLTSEEEQKALNAHVAATGYDIEAGWYIGYSDDVNEGDWRWVTGERSPYTLWSVGEPNNALEGEDYAVAWGTVGAWADVTCNHACAFVCEWGGDITVPYLSVNKDSLSAGWQAGNFSFAIDASDECSIASDAAWISVDAMSDRLHGTVGVRVSENTGDAREGTIIVSSGSLRHTVTVRQGNANTVTRRALCIGTGAVYADKIASAYDARQFGIMLSQQRFDGAKIDVSVLANPGSKQEAVAAIADAFAGATERDVSYLYLMCHGTNPADGEYNILIAQNGGFITSTQLRAELDKVPGTIVLILGSCFSGDVIDKSMDSFMSAFSLDDRRARSGELLSSKYKVITANTKEHTSIMVVGGTWGYGLMSGALAKGAGYDYTHSDPNACDWFADTNGDGSITLAETFDYASVEVKRMFIEVASPDETNPPSQVCVYPENDPFVLFSRN